MKYQKGMGFLSAIFIGLVVIFAVVLITKSVPIVLENQKIQLSVEETAREYRPGDSRIQVSAAFNRRADIQDIEVNSKMLNIQRARSGNGIVITYDYDRRIPLFGPLSLLFDYHVTSDASGTE